MNNKALFGLLMFVSVVILILIGINTEEAPEEVIEYAPSDSWSVEVLSSTISTELSAEEIAANYEGIETTVASVQKPTPGNVYLVLELEINSTGEPEPFSWDETYVTDETGNSFYRLEDDYFLEYFNMIRINGTDLESGSHYGYICFEIPESSAKDELTLHWTSAGEEQSVELYTGYPTGD